MDDRAAPGARLSAVMASAAKQTIVVRGCMDRFAALAMTTTR
jgi:hypothetical protein